MSNSLELMQPARSPRQRLPNSLMSTAHTVRPDSEAPDGKPMQRPPGSLSLSVVGLGALSATLALVGAATLSHVHERPTPAMQIVSGSPLLKKSSDGDSVRWHTPKTTLYLDASLDTLGDGARDAVQLGFGAWLGSGAKLPGLRFDSTKGAKFGVTPNGKSEVMYGPITIQGHENDLALTITFSDPKTGEVVESDMIFNSSHAYALLPGADNSASGKSQQGGDTKPGVTNAGGPTSTAGTSGPAGTSTSANSTASTASNPVTCNDKYDLQSVATHEAGHYYGLGEDYDVKTATMYYTTGRCETNKRALQTSDEATMDALYVANVTDNAADPSTDTGKGCGGARIGQGQTDGAGALLSLVGLLGFVSWRRRRR